MSYFYLLYFLSLDLQRNKFPTRGSKIKIITIFNIATGTQNKKKIHVFVHKFLYILQTFWNMNLLFPSFYLQAMKENQI